MDRKKLGFWSIVLLTINAIIGSGIFVTPGEIVAKAGVYTPLVYVGAAVFAGVLALTFASAAKYVTKAGSAFAYAKAAFGKNVGFYVGVTRFVSASIAWGTMAVFVTRTTYSIFGNMAPSFLEITLGFIVLMAILLVINLMGTKIFEFVSNISTIGKIFALVATMVFGLIIVMSTGENHFSEAAKIPTEAMTSSSFLMAVISAFYAFTGFESIASGTNDMEKPEKNLPKAIPLGIAIVALVYIAVVGISMMVNPGAIVASEEVVKLASIFENDLLRSFIVLGALVSMFGINVAASFVTPRVLEAMAEEKQVPAFLSKRNSKDVPVNSFIVTAIIAIAIPMSFAYATSDIAVISALSRFVQFLFVPLAVICFYYNKSKEPLVKDAKRSMLLDVIIPAIAFIFTVVLLIFFDWTGRFTIEGKLNWFAIGAMLTGFVLLPLILHFQRRDNKSNS